MALSLGSLPTFTDGQVMSASFHLNALQRYVQSLHDEYIGVQMPMSGYYGTLSFDGVVRHKANTLQYNVTIHTGAVPPFYIKVNDVTKATLGSVGNHAGTVDLTSMALTEDEFYSVTVAGGGGKFEVHLLREIETVSVPTLVSFANDTTPTAAEWQALSTYAAALASGLDQPVAVGTYDGGAADSADGGAQTRVIWAGTINHRCRYLSYKIYLRKPFNDADAGGLGWIDGYLSIDGTDVWRRRVGKAIADPGGLDFDQRNVAAYTWTGTLDLDTYPGTLVQGDDYKLQFRVQDSTFWDDINYSRVEWLYESPAADQELTSWSEWRTWSHGNYVWGDANPVSNPKLITTIKGNLETIGATNLGLINPVARKRATHQPDLTKLFGVRRRKWLHYRNEDDDDLDPRLEFTYRGETQSVSLPDASDEWLTLDMDSVDGLWPGTNYILADVLYAIEDTVP